MSLKLFTNHTVAFLLSFMLLAFLDLSGIIFLLPEILPVVTNANLLATQFFSFPPNV